ncbi:MAG: ABC transporter permease subunit [Bacilli bacterium]|jgi:ABC-2 type transport system permease protein
MNLIKIEFKKNFKSCLIWAIVLSSILFLYLAFFPSMRDAGFSELLDGKLDMMPEGLLDSLGLKDMPDFSVFMEYYCYVFQFIAIGLVIYAMILGTKALSKEEGDKTIEFLYAKPVTRTQIVLSKMISSKALILFVSLCLIVISIISDFIFGSGNTLMIILVNAMMLIPVFVYWSIGFAISSFLKDDSKSITIALGLFFGSYLIGIIANTIEKLDFLKYLAPISYNPASAIFKFFNGQSGAELNITALVLSAIIFVLGIIITFAKYSKKDLLN